VVSPCIFCKIIRGEIKSSIVKENDYILVIKDISPKAPIHYLILTKKHIESMAYLTAEDKEIGASLCMMIQELSKELPEKSFNIVSNNGAAAGQSVFHMHMHFLAGKNIYGGGFSL
jgi:diadenosine tetraphosphate (Ap4A) HIT family hydrolase